jgi:serine/threonine-protein kinase
LDQTQLQPISPLWTSPHASDARAAWAGSYPGQPDTKIHVEAAAFAGKPVYFEIFHVWSQPREQTFTVARFRDRALIVLLLGVFITVMLASALLALRNLRLGRGDRKGAFRLAMFVLAVFSLRWLFTSHHVATESEAFNFISSTQNMLFWTFFFWVVYLAFEPFVRRRWPGRIISWSRVLAGGFRDPLVGRDILIGALTGLGIIVCNLYLPRLVQRWLGHAPDIPFFDFPATRLLGIRSFAFGFTQQIFAALFQSFILLFVLLLLYIIVRRERLAGIALWLIGATALALTQESAVGVPFAVLAAGLIVVCMYRYGLLAAIVAIFFLHLMIFFPITSDFSAWYATDFVLSAVIGLALVGFGFYTSLAGEPLFRGARLDD